METKDNESPKERADREARELAEQKDANKAAAEKRTEPVIHTARRDQNAPTPANSEADPKKASSNPKFPNHPAAETQPQDQPYPDRMLNQPGIKAASQLYDRVKQVLPNPPTPEEISGWSADEKQEVRDWCDRAHLGIGTSSSLNGAAGTVDVPLPDVLATHVKKSKRRKAEVLTPEQEDVEEGRTTGTAQTVVR